jgi:uncharacterized protein (TIGR03435 family)
MSRLISLLIALQIQFEVASIKPSLPGANGSTLYDATPERFAASNITSRELIAQAYDVRSFQISGGPAWLASGRYDIIAKPEGEPTAPRIKAMLRELLKERFHLKLHTETRDTPVYHLVPAKNGSKLKPTAGEGPSMRGGRGRFAAQKITCAMLATLLSERLERPILDRTGITGEFDIALEWTPDESPEAGASIFTAIQEQLGLKLEAGRGPVEIIVIDRIDKPSAN